MKVKEILEIGNEEFEKIMTNEEFDRMKDLGMEYTWQLLEAMQDGAKESGLGLEEDYISISAYLDYLEEIK